MITNRMAERQSPAARPTPSGQHTATRRHRRRVAAIAWAGAAIVVLAVLAVTRLAPAEPRYHGKSLSSLLLSTAPDFVGMPTDSFGHIHDDFWSDLTSHNTTAEPSATPPDSAIRIPDALPTLDSRAVPHLLRWITSRDTPAERAAAWLVGHLPPGPRSWLQTRAAWFIDNPSLRRHVAAEEGFRRLGDLGSRAIPALSNQFFHVEPDIHTALSLAHVGPAGINTLVAGVEDTQERTREVAALALGLSGTAARPAIPALLTCVEQGRAGYQVLGALGRLECKDPRLVPALLHCLETSPATNLATLTDSMVFLLLGLQHERARPAAPVVAATYLRFRTNPHAHAERRLVRRVLHSIAPDELHRIPEPVGNDELSDEWP